MWTDRIPAGEGLLMCGDWKQIPPVGGTPVYKPDYRNATAAQGHDLYNQVNFVVFLITNMRARTDQLYTDILRRMRWGHLTTQDVTTLNTRVGASCGSIDPASRFFRPVVASTNSLRCAVNYRTTLEAGRTGRVQFF